jgi:prolipoprotein diacylglyceryltransferase
MIDSAATHSLAVHPLQLYFVASGLTITAVSLWLGPRKRYDGQVALVALLLFSSVSVAGLEFFRADVQPRVYWGALPQLAWSGLAIATGTLLALAWAEMRRARRRSIADPRAMARGIPPSPMSR